MEIFTIVTTVKEGHESALESLLNSTSPTALFGHIDTLHFASFIVFPAVRFGTDRATLVFEINVDGSKYAFISAIESDARIHAIYAHCEGYPSPKYLEHHIKLPHLFHVGTPHRSAVAIKHDRVLRDALDTQLFASSQLTDLLCRPAAGVLEYWTWEVFQPWIAWLLGVIVLTTTPVLFEWLRRHAYPLLWGTNGQRIGAVALFLISCLVEVATLGTALWLWFTALPPLRTRTRTWLPWLAVAAGLVILVASARTRWSIAVAGAFGLLFAFNVYSAVQRRRNERLADIRPDSATRSIVSAWNELRALNRAGDRRPPWWRYAWNWRWWAVAYAVVCGAVYLANQFGGRPAIVGLLAIVYLAKAVWLATLVGWPAGGPWFGYSPWIAAFIAGVPIGATVVAIALTNLSVSLPFLALLALLVLGTIFALWAIPLPSPHAMPQQLRRAAEARLLDQEDRDVQNHMAAVVVLRDSNRPFHSRVRVAVLKSLLGILNAIFFRAWLPDVCKGKLFNLPTVHACQWLVLDSRNYLFLSNYDHSWTRYLDDFGIELTTGIQKIWGQGEGNPGTTNLVRFKEYARATMVPYALWYQAYPGLTVRQIWNNEIIRQHLVDGADEEAMVRSLRRFGAAPNIPADEVAHARVN